MVRTGIYGGTFNPIHRGHTTLGSLLVEQGFVDELWFMVSPQNPLKASHDVLPRAYPTDEQRLHMARLAVGEDETGRLRVSDFEFHLPRPSYTIHTLQALRETYPDRQLHLVIGADNWEHFHQWYHSDEILRDYPLIVLPRPGYSFQQPHLQSLPTLPISSTHIREQIRKGDYDGRDLHPAVWHEIQTHRYYL